MHDQVGSSGGSKVIMDSTDHKYVLAATFENLYTTLLRKKGIRVLLSNLGTKQDIRVFLDVH